MGIASGNKATIKKYHEKVCSFEHRAAGSENEKKVAKMLKNEYEKLGLASDYFHYKIYKDSIFRHIIVVSLCCFATMFFFLNNRMGIALPLYLIVVLLELRKPIDLNKVLQKVVGTESTSVFSKIEKESSKVNIVITGHLDTCRRTLFVKHYGKVFGWILGKDFKKHERYKHLHTKMPQFFQGPFIFLNTSIFILGVVIILALIGVDKSFLNTILWLASFSFFSGIFYPVHALLSKYVPGAYDNGSGTSMVLSLANHFSKEKFENINLYFVNNSAEETYTRTVAPLLDSLKLDKDKTAIINLDSISSELLIAFHSECDDVGFKFFYHKRYWNYLARFVNQSKFKGKIWEGYAPFASDACVAGQNKYKVMVTLASLEKDGFTDQYHQMEDTIEKSNYDTMELCFNFVKDLVNSIDKEGYSELKT